MTNSIKEKIAWEVIRVLVTRFESFPEDASTNRNAPFHEAFLNAFEDDFAGKVSDVSFFITLSSWLQGLNTTLGQTFFENVAQILCDGEKREYTSKKLGNLKISRDQKSSINSIMTELSNSISEPDVTAENKKLIEMSKGEDLVNSIDFSADVYFEDDEKVVAIELKSVKPNSGEMRGEKHKILEGKAALSRKFRDKKIHFYIGFPFDPTSEESTSYNKERFLESIINMNKYFDSNETLLSSELWDFLSGEENTMEKILDIINIIATKEFTKKYQKLNNGLERNSKEYLEILEEWYLFSELELCSNYSLLTEKVKGDKKLTKVLNKHCFDNKGKYIQERFFELSPLISK